MVDGNVVCFNPCGSNDVYSYDSDKQMWSSLPLCPHKYFSLTVVNGLLTTTGGGLDVTNQLFSLTGVRNWMDHIPPMTTKRNATAAVCSGKSLAVARGSGGDRRLLDTVEVMDTKTLQWSTASSLPFALKHASATIFQDHIYLLGYDTSNEPRSVLNSSPPAVLSISVTRSSLAQSWQTSCLLFQLCCSSWTCSC